MGSCLFSELISDDLDYAVTSSLDMPRRHCRVQLNLFPILFLFDTDSQLKRKFSLFEDRHFAGFAIDAGEL